jgi:hypothetical protein
MTAFFAAILLQDWWNGDWTSRRAVELANRADRALPAGSPVTFTLDESIANAAELVVLHGGKPMPFLAEKRDRKVLVRFRTAAEIARGARDAGYAIYYGNASAPANATKPAELWDFHEDFDGAPESVAIDAALKTSIDKGMLAITDVAVERSELAPARIALKGAAPKGAFAIEVDFDVAVKEDAQAAVGLLVEMKEKALATDDATAKKVRDLVDRLGDESFETREEATKELVKLGRAALAKVQEAARSADAEIKWRAEAVAKKILSDHPPKSVLTLLKAGDAGAKATRVFVAGGRRLIFPNSIPIPGRVAVRFERDDDGEIAITWNGTRQEGVEMAGEIREISIVAFKGVAGAIGRIGIDRIAVGPFLMESERPSVTVQPEEKKK